MHDKALQAFHGLAIVVLATILFTLHPSKLPEVSALQNSFTQQFSIAWQQTLGDQPYFSDTADIYNGLASFFDQASQSTMALLADPGSDQDIVFVYGKVYADIVTGFKKSDLDIASNIPNPVQDKSFMTEAAIYNIVPGSVAGASTTSVDQPKHQNDSPWFTATDGLTGQTYCVGVYNGEINQYLGGCKDEYH